MTSERPRRRRLAISLRVLLLLVLAIGLWLGWLVHKARQQRAVVEAVKRHGGSVQYDWEFSNGKPNPGGEPRGPSWLRRALGDEYFQEIQVVDFVGITPFSGPRTYGVTPRPPDDVLALLSSQSGLHSLYLEGEQISDRGLACLRGLSGLEDLLIWNSSAIGDDGLESLRDLTNLKTLCLDRSRGTDRGFLALSRLTKLERLGLSSHGFSDRGFAAVRNMRHLKWLCAGGSPDGPSSITDESLALISGMTDIENLQLPYTRIADRGLRHLGGLRKLLVLDLSGCALTDAGLAELSGVDHLIMLKLKNTQVTDQGLEHVKGLTKLMFLELGGTPTTTEGKRKLMQAMPTLQIMD